MKKQYEIEVPEGKELDLERSNLVFKNKYPISVREIKGRVWYVGSNGIYHCDLPSSEHLSSKERAEGFLALIQLVELCDAWNKIDGFVPDYDNYRQEKFYVNVSHTLALPFSKLERLNEFRTQFKDLIDKSKKII